MRFAILDPEGDGLSWASRLKDEGADVLYYVHEPKARLTGEGIVRKSNSLHEMLAWAKAAPTIAVFMFSGMGKKSPKVAVGADEFAKAGIPTLLGGGLMDRLENDRDFGIGVANDIGVNIPPYFQFSTVRAAQKFCKAHGSTEWYFKPNHVHDCDTTYGGSGKDLADYLDYFAANFGDNLSNILQMKVPGVAISTGSWFNGYEFLYPFEQTIEHKKLMNNDIGPSTGCAINVVWMEPKETPLIKQLHFDRLAKVLQPKNCNPCLIDINAVIAEEAGPWGPKGSAQFLEWTPRCGWDSEATSQGLLTGTLSEFLTRLASRFLADTPFRTDAVAYGVRVSLSPYPYVNKLPDNPKPSPQGKRLGGFDSLWKPGFVSYGVAKDAKGYYVSGHDGAVGICLAVDKSFKKAVKQAEDCAKGLKPSGLQYRTDGYERLSDDAKKLKEVGVSSPLV